MKTNIITVLNYTKGRFFNSEDELTIKVNKNIFASLLFKSFGVATNFILVPVTLDYLSPTKYGLWLTLSSILHWISFFDLGLSSGLRNKFAEAKSAGDIKLAQLYTSTTYATVSIIAVLLILISLLLFSLINWESLLTLDRSIVQELKITVLVIGMCFSIRLVAGLIFALLAADNKVGIIGLFDVVTNLLLLVSILILRQVSTDSLLYAGISFSFLIAIVPILGNFWFFKRHYRQFAPKVKDVSLKFVKELMQLGGNFFFLQITVLVLFFSNNFIITALLGPEQVTVFNIPYKYISVITQISVIILNPYWTAATIAYQNRDFKWFKKTKKHLIILWAFLTAGVIVMVFISPFIYEIWINEKVIILFSTTSLIGVYTIIIAWNNTFAYLLNGIGELKLQLRLYMFAAISLVPLSYILAKTAGMGLDGILIANIVVIAPMSIVLPLRLNKLTSIA